MYKVGDIIWVAGNKGNNYQVNSYEVKETHLGIEASLGFRDYVAFDFKIDPSGNSRIWLAFEEAYKTQQEAFAATAKILKGEITRLQSDLNFLNIRLDDCILGQH